MINLTELLDKVKTRSLELPLEFDGTKSSEGKLRFMKKHKVKVTPDANGNGDDVFKATNVADSEEHGYNRPKGEDAKVYEEVSLGEKTYIKSSNLKQSPKDVSLYKHDDGTYSIERISGGKVVHHGTKASAEKLWGELYEAASKVDSLATIAKKHDMKYTEIGRGAELTHPNKGKITYNRYGEWRHHENGAKGDSLEGLDAHLSTLKNSYEPEGNQIDEYNLNKSMGLFAYINYYVESQSSVISDFSIKDRIKLAFTDFFSEIKDNQ